MMYPLQQLLEIRSIRENIAMARTVRAQTKVAEAVSYSLEKKKQFIECRNDLCRQEDILLQNARNRKISLIELETLQEKLSGMKFMETQYHNDAVAAAEKVEETKMQAERVRTEYCMRQKQKKKIEEHFQIWCRQQRINRERALEEDQDELTIGRKK